MILKLTTVNLNQLVSSDPDDIRIPFYGKNSSTEVIIPPWFLLEDSLELATVITHVFNSSLREHVVPGIWKMANVQPIPPLEGDSNGFSSAA